MKTLLIIVALTRTVGLDGTVIETMPVIDMRRYHSQYECELAAADINKAFGDKLRAACTLPPA